MTNNTDNLTTNMEFKTKRRFSFVVINIFMFLGGIEYAVIFPTLWEYLRSLGVPESNVYYLGLCISAVTITDMFMGLFIGRLLDKFSRVLPFILVLNIFQILGSGLYFFGISPTFILISRLIEGLGNAIGVVFLTDVCRATTIEERTPVLLFFNLAQQLGLLLGPACNLFLRDLDFYIGTIHVTKLNAPGFFLAVIYALFEILAYFAYYDLKVAKDQEINGQSDTTPILNQDGLAIDNDSVDALREEEEVVSDSEPIYDQSSVPWSRYVTELARGEIIVLMFIRFIGLFGQTCLETIVTPMMRTYFDYDDFANSILYLSGGGVLILVFIALTFASKKFTDRSLIFFGLILNIITYIWFLSTVPYYKLDDRSNLWSFSIGTVLDLASIPILLDISLSLFSKLLSDDVQGFGHAVRRFMSSFAMFIGPLWGSGSLPWLNVLFSIPLVLLVLSLVMFLTSFKQLIKPTIRDNSLEEEIVEESTQDLNV